MATCLEGSRDLYEDSGRRPYASINFITAHDGFTLHDLVSYNEKHNHANLEDGRDGENHNLSWNCGHEGPTDDPHVRRLRERQKRNFIATLFLSQGVPMLSGGDELGRTQLGNNNADCQDNELSWTDWTPTEESRVREVDMADPHAKPNRFEGSTKYRLDRRSVAVVRLVETPRGVARAPEPERRGSSRGH